MNFVRLRNTQNGAEYDAPETSVGHWLSTGFWEPVEQTLTARTKDELQQLAKDRGVPVPANAKKADLVEAVAAVEARPPAPR